MVTEPEAAAIYTARYLKSKKNEDFLKVTHFNENDICGCFLLLSARRMLRTM